MARSNNRSSPVYPASIPGYSPVMGYSVRGAPEEAISYDSPVDQSQAILKKKPKKWSFAGLGYTGQVLTISFLALMAVLILSTIGNGINGKSSQLAEKIAESGGTPTAREVPLASVGVAPSIDLTGFWLILGAIGGVLAVILLAGIAFWVFRRSRRSGLALKQEQAAIAEDRRKALLVWQQSVDRHRELSSKVIEIETDWTMLFSYPALVDASVPATREFHRALREIETVSSEPPAGLNLAMDISELSYPRLVAAANEAWLSAWSFAQHTGTKLIPRGERKKIDQILKLLKLAQSSGGSEAERSVAYGRAEKLIRELQFVKVPAAALTAIGTEQRLMIEGATPAVEPILVGVAPHRTREKV